MVLFSSLLFQKVPPACTPGTSSTSPFDRGLEITFIVTPFRRPYTWPVPTLLSSDRVKAQLVASQELVPRTQCSGYRNNHVNCLDLRAPCCRKCTHHCVTNGDGPTLSCTAHSASFLCSGTRFPSQPSTDLRMVHTSFVNCMARQTNDMPGTGLTASRSFCNQSPWRLLLVTTAASLFRPVLGVTSSLQCVASYRVDVTTMLFATVGCLHCWLLTTNLSRASSCTISHAASSIRSLPMIEL